MQALCVFFQRKICNFVPRTIYPLWKNNQSYQSGTCREEKEINDCQPTMEAYLKIAVILDRELMELVRTKKRQMKYPSF